MICALGGAQSLLPRVGGTDYIDIVVCNRKKYIIYIIYMYMHKMYMHNYNQEQNKRGSVELCIPTYKQTYKHCVQSNMIAT